MTASAPTIELRPYQQEIVGKLLAPPRGISRSLAVVATGGGKTIIFAALADRMLQTGERALVLAHREELLAQAREKIALAAPSLNVEIEQAGARATREHGLWTSSRRTVVIGSVQTMQGKRLESWPRDAFRLVIIDEAHHATAVSYQSIAEHFRCMDPESTRLVGVTATPMRTDGIGLGHVFQEIAANYDIRKLVKLGYLVPIRARRVWTGTDLRSVSVRAGDYAAGELEHAVDTDDRNTMILAAYDEFASGSPTIIFAAGVGHAKHLADKFRMQGHAAQAVWGEMGTDARRDVLESYQRGGTAILTNYNVLTEGFDAPNTRCIILARPTKSALVLTQMIGRGTRLASGKDHCLIIDVKDVSVGMRLGGKIALNGKGMAVGPEVVAGLPNGFDAAGEDVFALADAMGELDPALHHDAVDAPTLFKLVEQARKGLSVAEIDLFAAITEDENVKALSSLAWRPETSESWLLRPNRSSTYEVAIDTLGRYVARCTETGEEIASGDDSQSVFARVDDEIRKRHPEERVLYEANAGWRQRPASLKQMAMLEKLDPMIALGSLDYDLTMGQAAKIIDSLLYAKHKKGRR